MAAPPVGPADFEATKINANDSACTREGKIAILTSNLYEFFSWMLNTDGSFTQDFLDQIGTGSSGLAAPTGLNATDDRTTDVTLTWAGVSSATSYSVYRGTTSDTSTMALVASGVSTTAYVDTGMTADQVYWYSVKASNASQISALSAATDGKRPSSSVPSAPVIHDFEDPNNPYEFIIPSGKTQMEVLLWGGGGSGGHRNCKPWTIIGTPYPGGGGASGAFYHVTGITVSATEVYIGIPGDSGTASYLFRGAALSAQNVQANPGGNGNDMTTVAGTPGVSPSVAGSNSMGSGTPSGDISVGNPGSGTTGGSAVIGGGFSAGAGGNGNQTCDTTPGSHGRIRVILT